MFRECPRTFLQKEIALIEVVADIAEPLCWSINCARGNRRGEKRRHRGVELKGEIGKNERETHGAYSVYGPAGYIVLALRIEI